MQVLSNHCDMQITLKDKRLQIGLNLHNFSLNDRWFTESKNLYFHSQWE